MTVWTQEAIEAVAIALQGCSSLTDLDIGGNDVCVTSFFPCIVANRGLRRLALAVPPRAPRSARRRGRHFRRLAAVPRLMAVCAAGAGLVWAAAGRHPNGSSGIGAPCRVCLPALPRPATPIPATTRRASFRRPPGRDSPSHSSHGPTAHLP